MEKDEGLIYPVLESLVLQRPLPESIGAKRIRATEVSSLEFENRMSEIMNIIIITVIVGYERLLNVSLQNMCPKPNVYKKDNFNIIFLIVSLIY